MPPRPTTHCALYLRRGFGERVVCSGPAWVADGDAGLASYPVERVRLRGDRSMRLRRERSELVERSFAHVYETGGGRRTWLRGRVNVSKRYLERVAAFDLGVVMRSLFGVGKPRVLQGAVGATLALVLWLWLVRAGWMGR